jgi:hypothetical protein
MHALVHLGLHPAISILASMLVSRVSKDRKSIGYAANALSVLPLTKTAALWAGLPPTQKAAVLAEASSMMLRYLPSLMMKDSDQRFDYLLAASLPPEWNDEGMVQDTTKTLGWTSTGLKAIGGVLNLTGIYAPVGAVFSAAGEYIDPSLPAGSKSRPEERRTGYETTSARIAERQTVDNLLYDVDPEEIERLRGFFKRKEWKVVQKLLALSKLKTAGAAESSAESEEIEELYSPEAGSTYAQPSYYGGVPQLAQMTSVMPGYYPTALTPQLAMQMQTNPMAFAMWNAAQQAAASIPPQTGTGFYPGSQRDCGCKHDSVTLLTHRALKNDWYSARRSEFAGPAAKLLTEDIITNTYRRLKRQRAGEENDFDAGGCSVCDYGRSFNPTMHDGEPFYKSSWFEASFEDLGEGNYGVIDVNSKPFKLRINNNAPQPRQVVSFAHETLHALNYMLKLGMSHEQLHDFAFILVSEVFPGIAALETAQAAHLRYQ